MATEDTPTRKPAHTQDGSNRRRENRRLPLPSRSTLTVGGALFVAGLLFGISAANAERHSELLELDLVDVVNQQQQNVDSLATQVAGLKVEKETLLEDKTGLTSPESAALEQREAMVGPGVTVTLDDAPVDFGLDAGTNVNETVVHQQDVDAVMNALWRGGAEFMAVQGERISPRTPVRCIGNVILVGSNSYAPPYHIEAVGDVDGMLAALDSDPSVAVYKTAAQRYNLGWQVNVSQRMEIPPADAPGELKFVEDNKEPPA